jgi:pimeloyl-ACP methyl ester carboxylesterase
MAKLHSHAANHLPRVETVVIEKAGHLVHLQQPAAFIEMVTTAWRSAVQPSSPDAPDSRIVGP